MLEPEWYFRLFYFPILDLIITTLLFFLIKAKRMTSEGPDKRWHFYYWFRLLLFCFILWYIPFRITIAFCLGLLMMLFGYIIFSLGYMAMREHPEKKSAVVNWGIYKYSRNSHYIASKITTLGIIVTGWDFSSTIYILLWDLFIIDTFLSHFAIISEEKINIEKFGNEYVEYMKKVPRYF